MGDGVALWAAELLFNVNENGYAAEEIEEYREYKTNTKKKTIKTAGKWSYGPRRSIIYFLAQASLERKSLILLLDPKGTFVSYLPKNRKKALTNFINAQCTIDKCLISSGILGINHEGDDKKLPTQCRQLIYFQPIKAREIHWGIP